jgi:hypothetical protein
MKLGTWLAPAVFGLVGAVVACSGTTTSAGGQYDSCLSSQFGSSCISCVKSNCPSALSNLENGCGDYFACSCPGGNFSAPNAMSQTCLSKATEASCVAAESPDGGSSCTACDSTCAASASSSGGGSGGVSNGSSGGSGGGSGGSGFGSSGGSGGSTGSSSGGSSGSSSGGTPCGNSALPGTAATSLTLTGVDLGDMNGATDWQTIGWNLDGKCTAATSTDVCALSAGAPLQTQDDGTGGIDNSFGENLCPIFDTLSSGGACSTMIAAAYLQTDATGSGTLTIPFGTTVIAYPVKDVHVGLTGSGGVVGGVMPTASLIAAWQAAAGCISSSLCSGSAFQSIAGQLQQASDIGADGTDNQGTTCDGISFGLRFTGSTPLSGLPAPSNCGCP